MNDLVVTFLQLLVYVDVLDVEAGIVLEPLLNGPVLRHFLLSFLHFLSRLVFDLHLFGYGCLLAPEGPSWHPPIARRTT